MFRLPAYGTRFVAQYRRSHDGSYYEGDFLKDLPDGIDYFKMSFQIEYNDAVNFNVIPNEMLIKNPWL
jgi:hypothetical protein